MLAADNLSTFVSIASALLALVAIIQSCHASRVANDTAKSQTKLLQAQTNLEMFDRVRDAKHRLENILAEHGAFLGNAVAKKADPSKVDVIRAMVLAAQEGYLNALDAICQSYIDEHTDRIRFKKMWQTEIRQAIQDGAYASFFGPGTSFFALMRVYNEWENHEKD